MKTKLRDYQKQAVSSAINALKCNDRCKVIMPCGTGKTLVGIAIAEVLGFGYRMLVQAPSLALIKQLLDRYAAERPECDIMVVCSDDSTAEEARQVYDIKEATTDPAIIAKRMKASENLLVFCTYQSSERIAEAIADHDSPGFDFGLFDEAHRMAGGSSSFNIALDESKIPIFKRVFMTATQRFANGKEFEEYSYASMDDETQFGPMAYEMRLSEAIEAGHLTDYEVCIFVVKESEIQSEIADNETSRDAAKRLAVAKAIQRRKLRKLLVYHNNVAPMKVFSNDTMPTVFARLKERGEIKGRLWSRTLDGGDPADKRLKVLSEFAKLPKNCTAMINNCHVLQEGVDVPSIDGIVLYEPRSNVVDLMQMIGRMIRNAPDKQIATLVMPIFVPAEYEDAIDDYVSSSDFSHVYDLIAALKSHDDRVAAWASRGRSGDGEGESRIQLEGMDEVAFEMFRAAWTDAIECRVLTRFENKVLLNRNLLEEWIRWYFKEYGEWPNRRSKHRFPDGSSVEAISLAVRLNYRGWTEGGSFADIVREIRGFSKKKQLTRPLLEEWIRWYFEEYGEWPDSNSEHRFPDGSSVLAIQKATTQKHRGWAENFSLSALVREVRGDPDKPELTPSLLRKWIHWYFEEHGEWPDQRSDHVFPDGSKCSAIHTAMLKKNRGYTGCQSLAALVREVRGEPDKAELTPSLLRKWIRWYFQEYGEWPNKRSKHIFPDGSKCAAVDMAIVHNRRGWTQGGSLYQLVQEVKQESEVFV